MSYVSTRTTFLVVSLLVLPAQADVVFTISNNLSGQTDKVIRVNSTGSVVSTLWSGVGFNPRGVAFDSASDRVFWADATSLSVTSAPVSGGTESVAFTRANGGLGAISIDSNSGTFFVTEFGNPTSNRAITSTNLAGQNAAAFYQTDPTSGLSLNVFHTVDAGFLYFSNNTDILRKEIASPFAQSTIVSGSLGGVRGLAVNAGTLYWLNDTANTINSQSIAGGPTTTFSLGASATPQGLATDGNFLYYAETLSTSTNRGINRIDFGLTTITNIYGPSNFVNGDTLFGVTAVPEPTSLAMLLGGSAIAVTVTHLRRRRVRYSG